MKTRVVENNSKKVAICEGNGVIITDGQSALDFAVNIAYEHECHNIAINKTAISEDFFKLSTGIAGEIAQKYVNYQFRLAIIGDFSMYESKALRDFIYECNNGRYLYFVSSENEALKKLCYMV